MITLFIEIQMYFLDINETFTSINHKPKTVKIFILLRNEHIQKYTICLPQG